MSHSSKNMANRVAILLADEEWLVLEKFSHIPTDPQGDHRKKRKEGYIRGAEEGKNPYPSLKSVKPNSYMSFNYWLHVKTVSTAWQEGGKGQGLWTEETHELPETVSSQQQRLSILGFLPSPKSKQRTSITWGNLSISPCLKTRTGGTNALDHFVFY